MPSTPHGLFFNYKDTETVNRIKDELQEEYNTLLNLKTHFSTMSIKFLRWIGIHVNDHQPITPLVRKVVDRHAARHECHIADNQHIYELTYSVEGKIRSKTYTTFAISEEQATGLLEDEVVRVLDLNTAPVVRKLKDYGPQPIGWCIEWTNRMIDDVEQKSKQANG